MNLIEYITSLSNIDMVEDEGGNLYLDFGNGGGLQEVEDILSNYRYDFNRYLLNSDNYEKFKEIQIILEKDIDFYTVRRPYYRMRGIPVRYDQAFDIIRKTDRFFAHYIDEIYESGEYIGCYHFVNDVITNCLYPQEYGWCHIDGHIGINGITGTYPNISQMVLELASFLVDFPYLDFCIAMTFEDDYWWEEDGDGNFENIVSYGFHVKDRKIRLIDRKETLKLYKEYKKICGFPVEIYDSNYYEKRYIRTITNDFIKNCVSSYGLNPDEILSKIRESDWIKER